MILAMNIGNTHFTFAWKTDNHIHTMRCATDTLNNTEDFVQTLERMTSEAGIGHETIEGATCSSVIPTLTPCLTGAIQTLFMVSPLIVTDQIPMNLNLEAYHKQQLGHDRIAICEGAIAKYKAPLIIADFGTATTINVIGAPQCFLGGSILPGLAMGLSALSKNTAQLPRIGLHGAGHPLGDIPPLIGRNTLDGLRSGAIYGNAAMLEGLIGRIDEALAQTSTVLITGGNAKEILPVCRAPLLHEPELLIEGLYALYNKNTNRREASL